MPTNFAGEANPNPQSNEYRTGWVMYGYFGAPVQSQNFEVGEWAVALTVEGLTGEACLKVQNVFGCASGDVMVDALVGCNNALTLTPCQTTLIIPISGRYRLLFNDPSGAVLPGDITVYARPTLINFDFGGLFDMANCGGCVGAAAASTLTSPDATLITTSTGAALTAVLNPVPSALALTSSPAAVTLFNNALAPSIIAAAIAAANVLVTDTFGVHLYKAYPYP